MKTKTKILLFCFITILCYLKANGQWNLVQNYGSSYSFSSIFFSSDSIGYITDGMGGNLFKSTDGGDTWAIIYTFPGLGGGNPKFIVFLNDTVGYIMNYGNVNKTTDGGQTWTATPLCNCFHWQLFFPSNSVGYAITNTGSIFDIYKTTNNGGTWSPLNIPGTMRPRSLYFTNDSTGYIVNYDTTAYKTIDGGTTWNLINTSINDEFIYIHFINDSIGYINGNKELWKTTDQGNNWNIIDSSVFSGYVYKTQFLNDSLGYAIGSDTWPDTNRSNIILKTYNGGLNWIELQTDEKNKIMSDIYIINDTIGFVIGGGKYDGSQWGVILKTMNGGVLGFNEINLKLKLLTVYPNPFTNLTVIEFENKKKEKHTLTLYNITGQLVQQIDNIITRKIEIERKNLTAGFYFFKLQNSNEIVGTGKLIIE